MKLLDKLTGEMRVAMKTRERARLSTLRMLVSAIRYAMIDEPEIDEKKVVAVLQHEAKKRRESIEAYRKGGREEQAQKEENEAKIIAEFLPAQMTEEQIREKVKVILNSESGIENIGIVIGKVMKEIGGQAEGGIVARMVKEEFNK